MCRSCQKVLLDLCSVCDDWRNAVQRLCPDEDLPQLPSQSGCKCETRKADRFSSGHCLQHESC